MRVTTFWKVVTRIQGGTGSHEVRSVHSQARLSTAGAPEHPRASGTTENAADRQRGSLHNLGTTENAAYYFLESGKPHFGWYCASGGIGAGRGGGTARCHGGTTATQRDGDAAWCHRGTTATQRDRDAASRRGDAPQPTAAPRRYARAAPATSSRILASW